MDANAYNAAVIQSIVDLVTGVAWPTLVLFLVLFFRSQIKELLDRVVEAEGFGLKGKFERTAATVAKAAAETFAQAGHPTGTGQARDATVKVRESLVSTLADLARENPSAAVLAAYAEVEKALRTRMAEAEVAGIDNLGGARLVDVALRKGVISRQTAEAIRGVQVLRNMAAHGRNVNSEKALDYLSLADAVLYSIETWRRSA